MPWSLIHLDTTESTSRHLRDMAIKGAPHGTVVIARQQTGGHGRLGRTWMSPPGALLLSLLLRPETPLPRLSLAVGIALHAAARTPSLHLKWPNDLLCGPDKCGGVLVEGRWAGDRPGYLVVGIGVNVAKAPDLSGTTCLADHDGPTDPEAWLPTVLTELAAWCTPEANEPGRVLPAWLAASRVLGQTLTVFPPHGMPWTGTAVGLDTDGALLLIDETGETQRLHSGEVRLTAPETRQAPP